MDIPKKRLITRAKARHTCFAPVDVRPGKATRASAQALHTQEEIRFAPQDRDRFAIYALGRDARCLKSWDDAAEE